MKRRLAGGLGAVAIALLALGAPVSAGAASTHRIVDDDGKAGLTDDGGPSCSDGFDSTSAPGVVFTTISAAVAAAGSGDTIFVCPGTYNETVSITKTLTLSGPYAGVADTTCKSRTSQATVIGTGSGPALSLAADGIVVDGLRVAGTRGTGIWTSPANAGYDVANNVLVNNGVGVDLGSNGGPQTFVSGNCFQDNNNGAPGYGIRSTGTLSNAVIASNGFSDHRVAAVALGGAAPAWNIGVTGNWSTDDKSFLTATTVGTTQVTKNHVGQTDDISVPASAISIGGASTTVSVDQNVIDSSHVDGVLIKDTATAVWIRGNSITNVTQGIDITSSAHGGVRAKNNKISDVQGTLAVTSAGILLGAATSGDRLSNNKVTGIADLHCQDLSVGSGTAGTANFWIHDQGLIDSPDVICNP